MFKEIWKDIESYEGLYKVSNFGRIKSLLSWDGHAYIQKEKILNPYRQLAGKNYYRSVICLTKNKIRKQYKVHKLVAEAFIPNPNNLPIINHIDGNPLNNKADNLEWCTQKHNIKHSLESELKLNVIKTIDRETMVDLLNCGKSYDDIAEILGIAKGTVFNYIKKFKIKKVYE